MSDEQELEKELSPMMNGLYSYFKFNLSTLISKLCNRKTYKGKFYLLIFNSQEIFRLIQLIFRIDTFSCDISIRIFANLTQHLTITTRWIVYIISVLI